MDVEVAQEFEALPGDDESDSEGSAGSIQAHREAG